jgi:uncharacterized repeat protein (TIGR03803 family)
VATLVQATDGDFYGTTPYGGANAGGTVFKITPGGALTTLYNFCTQANCTDGDLPSEALVQATNGKLYGTTADGGGSAHCGNGCGTVFEITPAGNLTTLHPFEYAKYGALPARLVQATNGNFYGTTSAGGDFHCDPYGCGTIFKLAVGLGPFVETLPTSGKVGTAVIILGNQLKGTTSVTFNGTAATFTVVSNTEIKTIVPTGATTGFVEVTTLTKTLKSNVVFRVTK